MTKLKTAELTGAALDWAVAKAEGTEYSYRHTTGGDYNGNTATKTRNYSTDWSQAGPIIEHEEISLMHGVHEAWHASKRIVVKLAGHDKAYRRQYGYGPTPLIAAMRCFIASKLGDEVDVPEELV